MSSRSFTRVSGRRITIVALPWRLFRPPPPDPLQSTTLLPFKSYAQMIKAGHPSSRDRSLAQPTTAELYEGYQTYRLAFQKRSMTEFFEEKRNEPWFRERYGLAEQDVQKRSERKREGRQGKKQKWLQELRNGELDGVSFDMKGEPWAFSPEYAELRT